MIPDAQKIVIAYSDADDSQKGKAIVGTVSGFHQLVSESL